MNEAQSLRTVRNVLRLENLSADIVAPVQRELTRILQEVAAMVEAMDADPLNATLFRQARWRTYEAQLRLMLEPVNELARETLIQRLAAEIPNQIKDAERQLLEGNALRPDEVKYPYQRADEFSPMPPPALEVRGYGEVVLPPGVSTDGSVGPVFTRTQLRQIAQETKVLGKPLGQLFQSASARPPVETDPRQLARYSFPSDTSRGGVFIRSQINNIDKVVKQGFLLGETNSEIANNLKTIGAARSHREAATIAHTAVMQMSADAHQAFYDANSSVIAGWEYDALMDTRACMLCAPWDGRTAAERKDLPAVPQHPRCRCAVLPLTETEQELRKERGPQRRTVIELDEAPAAIYEKDANGKYKLSAKERSSRLKKHIEAIEDGSAKDKHGNPTTRVYAKPVLVDGKWFLRVAKDIPQKGDHPLTHGEFLARLAKKAPPEGMKVDPGLRKALVSDKRVLAFKELLKTKTPDEALLQVTRAFYRPEQMTPRLRNRSQRLPPIGHSRASVRAVDGKAVANAPKVREIPRQRRPRPGVTSAEARRLQNLLRRRGVRLSRPK